MSLKLLPLDVLWQMRIQFRFLILHCLSAISVMRSVVPILIVQQSQGVDELFQTHPERESHKVVRSGIRPKDQLLPGLMAGESVQDALNKQRSTYCTAFNRGICLWCMQVLCSREAIQVLQAEFCWEMRQGHSLCSRRTQTLNSENSEPDSLAFDFQSSHVIQALSLHINFSTNLHVRQHGVNILPLTLRPLSFIGANYNSTNSEMQAHAELVVQANAEVET